MEFATALTDEATLAELGRRLARYRLNRNLTQAALAREAGVSPSTLHRIEHGQSTQLTNFVRLLRALDLLDRLDALVPSPATSPLQQLKLGGRERRRASSEPAEQAPAQQPWSWGDDS
ncbi:MAG: transcriptional regulator [Halioglobus sp.]|nr:transcriptional regulator [Halioglobus sp.]|tara:strand:- start:4858 stop:5211 length:354 start_codon:yes stop_codon:yes gene_type:complete